MLKRRNICHSQEQDQTCSLTITGRRGHSSNPIKRKSTLHKKYVEFVVNQSTLADFVEGLVKQNRNLAQKILDFIKELIGKITGKGFKITENYTIREAEMLSEADAKDLQEIRRLFEKALAKTKERVTTATETDTEAQKNTDSKAEGEGDKRYSINEKALSKNEYVVAKNAIINNHKGVLIDGCAVYVISDNNVDNTKIVCYNKKENSYDFDITDVYLIENYDYTVNDKYENPAVIIAKGVKNGYSVEEIKRILQNSNIDDGQVFKKYSNESSGFVELGEFKRKNISTRGRKLKRGYFFDETGKIQNKNIKLSLSTPVEQVGELVAVHNLNEQKLKGNFELGGLPAPSVAITKADVQS